MAFCLCFFLSLGAWGFWICKVVLHIQRTLYEKSPTKEVEIWLGLTNRLSPGLLNDTLNQMILTEDVSTLYFTNRRSVSLPCFGLNRGKHLPNRSRRLLRCRVLELCLVLYYWGSTAAGWLMLGSCCSRGRAGKNHICL